jgi:O-antigen ligase
MYLAVLFQGGIVGVLLFGSLLLATLKALLENYDQPDAKLALGILTIALTAYMLDGHELIDKIGSTWFLIWLPVAIALGLRWNRPAQ